MPLPVLRTITQKEKAQFRSIGASCHSLEEAQEAQALGCSYITAGHKLKQALETCKVIDISRAEDYCAATMLWSRYCPSLRDTGMVSTATGFLDFMSYMAAAISSAVFASAVSEIGWRNLILICVALMVLGTILSIPKKR